MADVEEILESFRTWLTAQSCSRTTIRDRLTIVKAFGKYLRPTTPTQPAANGCGTGCLIWAMIPVICLLLVVLIAAFDHGSASNAYPAEAQVHCRDFVKEALKSPSSAHFSNEQATGSGLLWTVNGEVDSDNSFGASIRNSYSCMVQVDKNDDSSWTLLSLTGLNN